jgi:putative transposase
MIKSLRDEFALPMMCRVLSVSRSGYYQWTTHVPSAREINNAVLDEEIKFIHQQEKSRVGAPRVTARLRRNGRRVSRKRVAKRMWRMGLRAKAARKFKATTNSNHRLPVAANLLQQDFTAAAKNQKWVSDITYIWTAEGWLYLAAIMDVYSRKIVGWAMRDQMTTSLVSDALKMAWWRCQRVRGVIVHSDRGSQYCSHEYQAQLKRYGMICSMSKRGDCYDNAMMESWNHTFKVEAIHGERFATREMARAAIFEYIDVYYNRIRLHSRLGYQSPVMFETQKIA